MPTGKMYFYQCQQPWDVVSVDLMGPFPRSKKGHCHLLVLQDKFTKWTELRPLRTATAAAIVTAVKEQVIYKFGSPRVIITDNGPQFTSKGFQGELAALGIQSRLTPPYTPQANPVERMNKVLGIMIAQNTGEDQRDWDQHLPEIAFAVNTSTHSSTGFTPALLNLGREVTAPNTWHRALHPDVPDEPPELAARTQVIDKLRDLFQVTRDRLAQAFVHQSHHYNLRRRPFRPQVGAVVYKRERPLSDKARKFNAKLAPKYSGPYIIRKVVSPVIVELRAPDSRKVVGRVHVKDLKTTPDTQESLLLPAEEEPRADN